MDEWDSALEKFWGYVTERLRSRDHSAAWLAQQIGLSRQALHHYMHGKRRAPASVIGAVAVAVWCEEGKEEQ